MDVKQKKMFVGHRLHIAVERVDNHERNAVFFDRLLHQMREFSGRELGWIDLGDGYGSRLHQFAELETEALRSIYQGRLALVENEKRRAFLMLSGVHCIG